MDSIVNQPAGSDSESLPASGVTRIAGKLRVLSRARDDHGANWSRLVDLINGGEKSVRLLIPDRLLGDGVSQQLFSALEVVGFDLPYGKADRNAIRDYLRNPAIDKRTVIVRSNGYVGEWAYVRGSRVIGASSRDFFLDPAVEADPQRYKARGTLAAWQREIASFVAGNARPMLAIMASFVGPIIKPLGLENGGLQFFGGTSLGKTALLACAASVIGPPSNGAMVRGRKTITESEFSTSGV
jgi:putative DNA primase/helicase